MIIFIRNHDLLINPNVMNANILQQAYKLVNKQVKKGDYALASQKAAELLPLADQTLHMLEELNVDGAINKYVDQMRVVVADLERIAFLKKAL